MLVNQLIKRPVSITAVDWYHHHNVVHPIVYQYESYHMSLIQSALCIQHHHKRGQEKPEVHEESQNFWTINNDVEHFH